MTLSFILNSVIIRISKYIIRRFKMKKLKNLLLLSGIIWTTTASHAINYEDRDCVHSYNIMNKYVDKVTPHINQIEKMI